MLHPRLGNSRSTYLVKYEFPACPNVHMYWYVHCFGPPCVTDSLPPGPDAAVHLQYSALSPSFYAGKFRENLCTELVFYHQEAFGERGNVLC